MDFEFIFEMIPQLGPAVRNALIITFSSMVIGWILGLIIALVRVHRVRILSQILAVYVSFLRSVPLVILLFFIYYAIPTFIALYKVEHGGLATANQGSNPIIYPIIAMGLSESAFASEIFRSALQAVSHGQYEAARSVGMTTLQTYRRIIFPQAFAIAIPNLGGQFINLIKASSLAYYADVIEITGAAYTLASPTYQFLEAFFTIGLIYEVLSFIFSKIFTIWERKASGFRKGIVVE